MGRARRGDPCPRDRALTQSGEASAQRKVWAKHTSTETTGQHKVAAHQCSGPGGRDEPVRP